MVDAQAGHLYPTIAFSANSLYASLLNSLCGLCVFATFALKAFIRLLCQV
jgi:hypothetical protein